MWSWILESIGITASMLIGRYFWWAWLLMLFNSVLWFIYGLTTKQYGFVVSAFVFGTTYALNARAWYNLRKKAIGARSEHHRGEVPEMDGGKSPSVLG